MSLFRQIIIALIFLLFPLFCISQTAFEVPDSRVVELYSKKLDRTYSIFIKTPPGYEDEKNKKRRYPVVYMTDGRRAIQIASGGLSTVMRQEQFEPQILVGLGYEKGKSSRYSRTRDYTPTEIVLRREGHITGGASDYLKFLKDEVFPYIESNYRAVKGERTYTGSSAGALFGSWVLVNEPSIFQNYILISPPIRFDEKVILEMEAAYAKKNKQLKAKVYLAVGSLEMPPYLNEENMVRELYEFVNALNSRNYEFLDLKYDVLDNALHVTAFPVGLMKGSHWLFFKGP